MPGKTPIQEAGTRSWGASIFGVVHKAIIEKGGLRQGFGGSPQPRSRY